MPKGFESIWLVLLLPVAGFLIQALGGKIVTDALGPRLGRRVMGWVATAFVAGSFLVATELLVRLIQAPVADRTHIVTLFDWITLNSISIPFEVRVDTLSMTMVMIITGIGALIHMYSIGYMSEERDFTRFFTYLNLFIAFMLILVLGNNLALLFIGWEGVGVCSYLLIGFWYKDVKNSKAANKAFIVNRIGDFMLTLGMFALVALLATHKDALGITDARWLSYDVILPHAKELLAANPGWATFIALMLFGGAAGKSAQFPLYIWLPDAMAGPTPVSALIHAATMVTSGVYLLNRMADVVTQSPVAMAVIALVGAFTALLGALIAFGQTDIKKVLAYSTVSQLGFMFIACGVGVFYAGLFHVVTHAFFKALLFLGSGAVIHAMAHEQDMRAYGNLRKYLPITYLTMGIGWAAIVGVPFAFAGFWSKEAILGPAVNATGGPLIGGLTAGAIAGWVGFFVAMLTAAYMTRMMVLTFGTGQERWRLLPETGHHGHDHDHSHAHHHHGDAHGDHHADHHGEDENGFFMTAEEVALRDAREGDGHHHELGPDHQPHEVPWLMWVPLAVLSVFSLGWFGSLLYNGRLFEGWLFPAKLAVEKAHGAVSHGALIGISFLVFGLGVGYALAKYNKGEPADEGWDMKKWSKLRLAAREQFWYDWVCTDGSLRVGAVIGAVSWWIDRNIIDGTVRAVGAVTGGIGGLLRLSQTGYVRGYALLMQLGVVALIGYVLYALFVAGGFR